VRPGAAVLTGKPSRWEIARGDTALKIVWATDEVDAASGRLRQRSRIEVLSGPRASEVLEEVHEMSAWTPERWRAVIKRPPFESAAIFDGGQDGRPRVPQGSIGLMLWHELIRSEGEQRTDRKHGELTG